jgi:hypothetical protein
VSSEPLNPCAIRAGTSAATPDIERWGMRTAKKAVPFYFGILFLLFNAAVLVGSDSTISQAPRRVSITVTISPSKATLFAGQTQVFVATVVGGGDRTVTWSVAEEDGGTITSQGLYAAPKVQGVYHIAAISTAYAQKRAVAMVTVLAYCDAPAALVRR